MTTPKLPPTDTNATGATDKVSCHTCGQSLPRNVMFGTDKFWCANHFTCATCNIKLKNYRDHNSRAYCLKCYEKVRPKCFHCGKQIQDDEEFVACEAKMWHEAKCFLCSRCNQKADPDAFYFVEDKIYCSTCRPTNLPPSPASKK